MIKEIEEMIAKGVSREDVKKLADAAYDTGFADGMKSQNGAPTLCEYMEETNTWMIGEGNYLGVIDCYEYVPGMLKTRHGFISRDGLTNQEIAAQLTSLGAEIVGGPDLEKIDTLLEAVEEIEGSYVEYAKQYCKENGLTIQINNKSSADILAIEENGRVTKCQIAKNVE